MKGVIMYEGPSVLDGSPIVVVCIGLEKPSVNMKTGPIAQIYILRADMHPFQAVQTGDDFAICGDCRRRGSVQTGEDGSSRNVGRSCYVTLMHGPRVVYDAYKRGNYTKAPLTVVRSLLKGRKVRVGAYGDPGAAPQEVWDVALDQVSELTAYTHLWRRFPALSSFCMASCDTEEERTQAKELGFRTFRVRGDGERRLSGEGSCPASNEMGHAVRCIDCMLCDGRRSTTKADITILSHGVGRNHPLAPSPAS